VAATEHPPEEAGRAPLRRGSRPERVIAAVIGAWTLYQAVHWFRLALEQSRNPQDGSYDILGYGIAPVFAIVTVVCLWFVVRRT
jgi:hypothetical protein